MGLDMSLRAMQEKIFCEAKYGVFLELDVSSGASADTHPVKEDASKGKEPALESSGKSAAMTKHSALIFQASKEAFLWSVASSRTS